MRFAWKTLRGVATAIALCMTAALAAAEPIEVLWLGHSTFRITSATGKVIVIDPFLKKNPRTPPKYKDLAALGKVDLILVTHAHNDHIADLQELARLTGATVIANYELAKDAGRRGRARRRQGPDGGSTRADRFLRWAPASRYTWCRPSTRRSST